MKFVLLYIRKKQLIRVINTLSLYSILLLALAFFLIFISYKTYLKGTNAFYLTAFLLISCLGIQSYRKDKNFIYQHVNNSHIEVWMEYLVLIFPFSVTALITKSWYCFFALSGLLYFIPFLKFSSSQKTRLKNLSKIIPAQKFEWISGIRKSFTFLVPMYLLALGFSWFRIFPLFLLWFITSIIVSFYGECESLQILQEEDKTPAKLLTGKIFSDVKLLFLLYLPVLAINTIFNSEYLLINILFIPIQLAVVCFAICLKYSLYKPGNSSGGNSVILSIVSLSAAIPYFLPIPIVMSVVYYFKAKHNLKNYLND